MYEKDKGVNDWSIKNLGKISDVKFVTDSSMGYVISQDGVLSMFDFEEQEILWRKKIVSKSKNFGLHYLAKNVMLVSDQKAVLLNTQGQVNLELEFQSLFGKYDDVMTDMFGFSGTVVSSFVANGQVVLYKNARYWKTIKLPANLPIQ
jgi:hypothetical protein